MWLILRRNTVLFVFVPFFWYEQHSNLHQIQIFLWILTISKLLKKKILSISELLSEIVNFFNIKGIFQWISLKILQSNRKAEFICCGSYWGETLFFKYICRIFFIWTTQLFTSNPNFPLDFNFSNLLRKTNFLCISDLSVTSLFCLKWEVFSKFIRKPFKKTRNLEENNRFCYYLFLFTG